MQSKIITNKYLLALACGDSYGSYYEFEGLCGNKFNIRSLPQVPVQPRITDDTKMATILLNHYQKNSILDVGTLIKEYRYWAKNEGNDDGIGIHTYEVLVDGKPDKNSQGNGSLMRVLPMALQMVDDGYDIEIIHKYMKIDASITHSNSTIFLINKLALDIALNGLLVLDKKIYKKLLETLHYGDTAWVIHSIYIVIEALKTKRTFVSGFKYIVSQGGDTDTNCAIFGAIRSYKHDITKEINIDEYLPHEYISN